MYIQVVYYISSRTVTLHGFDITDRLFPDPSTIRKNVSFSLLNVLEPISETLYEKYDVVHIRGLSFVLKIEEWDGVVKNVAKMIRPGGYLVWNETNPGSTQTIPPTKVASQGAALPGYMCELRGGNLFCCNSIPNHLKNNGFVIIPPLVPSASTGPIPEYAPVATPAVDTGFYIHVVGGEFKPETVETWSRNYVSGLCSLVSYMAQNDVKNEWFTPETAGEFVEEFLKETGEGGSRVFFDLITVIGRKEI
ncbi:hypothetical protein TWF569_001392 [Orbilia oligospora]|uniref:Methyltransferase type 11 domain-containing protein n=1 Tax=Orbilia oligospora TaxID=2813651 RepID=A0A7C8N8S9_ORBOL|nr:hypothetical protein TWF102_000577 [Orbilia oligospora]KAF3117432.1 hypothetical protein TWF103_006175 [Orbilia oligospora]KAF3121140.1 hypothetical protein TWF594_003416 [Orbilia oligospora]KAF3153788.1 hypothetical protein TWF569_001392 [Orbilia oligospora]